MTLDAALRLTEVLLGLAFIQQSLEHVFQSGPGFRLERVLFGLRIGLCVLLVTGFGTPLPLVALAILSLWILDHFQGPYNGGSDRMGLLALWCLTLTRLMPNVQLQEVLFGYLGVQLILSYFFSGWVKVLNPQWRTGRALRDVFLFSAYPVSEGLRSLAKNPRLMFILAWTVMLFELAFPLAIYNAVTLRAGLGIAAVFHLINAAMFGLNRFFWTWLAAFPALIWLQARIA